MQFWSRKQLGGALAALVVFFLVWQFAAGLREMVAASQRYTLQLHEDTRKLHEEMVRLHAEERSQLQGVRDVQDVGLKAVSDSMEKSLRQAVSALQDGSGMNDDLVKALHSEFVQVGITLRDELAAVERAARPDYVEEATRAAVLEHVITEKVGEVSRHLDDFATSQQQDFGSVLDGLHLLLAQTSELLGAVRDLQESGVQADMVRTIATIEEEMDDEEEGPQNPCIAVTMEDKYVEDESWRFDEALDGVTVDSLLALDSEYDVFSTSVKELFEDDPLATLIYRLGFPSTSSTNMRQRIVQGGNLTPAQRIPGCADPQITGCGGAYPERDAALARIRRYAGNVTTLRDVGQHTSLELKKSTNFKNVASAEGFHKDQLLGVTMLREPAQYAYRVFSDRQPTGKTFEEEEKTLHVRTLSHELLHFDWAFEERTNCSLRDATLPQWIDLAHWRWNYFTRGLADDYHRNLWVRFVSDSPGSRETAWHTNEQGKNSPLLADAIDALHDFDFFGIYDRLEESMELLFFTFCWDSSEMGFEFIPPTRAMRDPTMHVGRGRDVVGDEAYELMRSRNRLDYLLFDYAERLFDVRVAAMRRAKENGYVCKLIDSACGVTCA